jgi:3-deoxy-D-manno-octulosonic-acid transferase
VTASLALYQLGTRLLEPLAPLLVRSRLKTGKERPERIRERFGHTDAARPDGTLLWLHGASVGESRLLLDLLVALRRKRSDLHALVTTQTLTSADMIASSSIDGMVHQMAPVDGPGTVDRFLRHWSPDVAIFAEGEIWPNMLAALKTRGVPAALVNARMTSGTLASWKRRPSSAREVFSAFDFIGAADQATADGLLAATGRHIDVVGNLKTASEVAAPPAAEVSAFRAHIDHRPVVLAASTHPGEDEFALDAFSDLRRSALRALLILVPRHPERGSAISGLARSRSFTTQQRSVDPSPPDAKVDVLVADTIGELLFWYAVADGVYLAGATAEGIGGHNPAEPVQLGKRVFTGPHGFNFRETFEAMEKAAVLRIGSTPQQLCEWWLASLGGDESASTSAPAFSASRAPFKRTITAVLALLPTARMASNA